MKKFKTKIALSFILLPLFFYGCNQEGSPSLYMDESPGSTPVIASVSPQNAALAGVAVVTINGSNFSSVAEDNFVFFGTAKATILSATPTELVVKAPVLIKDNIELKIAVKGAENFSNKVTYSLLEAVGEYYPFKDFELPYALTMDNSGNMYFSFVSSNIGQGVMKLTPDGVLSNFAPRGAETFYNDLKVGKNNTLYGARNVRAVFAVQEGKTPAVYVTFPTGAVITEIDFDANDNLWAGGRGNKLFSVDANKSVKDFAINYDVSAIRVYNNYLYAAGNNESEEAVWRYNIVSATELGAGEKYFDIAANFGLGTVSVNDITFSADGDLFIGTDQADAIIAVHSDKSFESLYPGLINPIVNSFTWGDDNNLYYVRQADGTNSQTIIRVDMQKLGAPYFGK